MKTPRFTTLLAAAAALGLASAPVFAAKIIPGYDMPIPKIPQQERFAGSTPSAVSTEIATKMVQQGDSGHVALFAVGGTSWQDQAEILEADPLASADQGVILLTPRPTGLGGAVTQWVRAHHVTTAVLIGAANTPALHQALAHLGVTRFQGLGNANPVTTGAAVAQALRTAMNESSLPGAIVMMPNDIADSVAAGAAASLDEEPIIIANPYTASLTTTIPAVEWRAINGPDMTTLYAVGRLGAEGVLRGVPNTVDIVQAGGMTPYQSTTAIDEHFIIAGEAGVVVLNSPVGLTEGAAAGAFAGGAINQIQPELAPIVLAQPGPYPLNSGMAPYMSTFDPHMWTSIGVGSAVTPQVLATFRQAAGHTAMAQLANRNIRYTIQHVEYSAQFMPPNPLMTESNNSPEVGSQNTAQSNYAGWINTYAPGGPLMPVTLRSVGIHGQPPSGAITGLTFAVREHILSEAAQQPLLAPLTKTAQGQQLLIQAVREAARMEIDINSMEQVLGVALEGNAEDSYNARADAANLVVNPGDAISNWVAGEQTFGTTYRAWVAVQPNVTVTTAPLAAGPVGAIRNTVVVKGLTLYYIASDLSNNHQHFAIVTFKAPNLSVSVDEIAANGLIRWYGDTNAAFYTHNATILWESPKNYEAAARHWPNPNQYLKNQ